MRRRIGRYEVLEQIGEGGMGAVFRAHDPTLDREVAIKVLSAELAADALLVRRFEEEARALAKVQHPNVMRIFAVGEDGGLRYYAMEFIVGRTLDEVLEHEGPMGLAACLGVFRQVLEAARAIHAAGIIHRDIKPGNIMLGEGGRTVLMDFGLAKTYDRRSFTTAGAILGTPEYMAPEQAQGAKVDARADIYSLGCVLFEMLTGRKPFEGKDFVAVIRSKLDGAAPSVLTFRPELPPLAEAILARALAREAKGRYADVSMFAGDLKRLEELAGGVREAAGPPKPGGTTTVHVAEKAQEGMLARYAPAPAEPRPKALGRAEAAGAKRDLTAWALIAFGLAAGLAGLGLLASWWLGRSGAPSGEPHAAAPAESAPAGPEPRRGIGGEIELVGGRKLRGEWLETFHRRDPVDGRTKMYGKFREEDGTIRELRLEDPPEVLSVVVPREEARGGEKR